MPTEGVQVEVDPKTLARVLRTLDKWEGEPLRKRMDKAIQGGAKLLLPAIRSATPRGSTGNLRKSVKVSRLRKRPGETSAWKVGPTAFYAHMVTRGTKPHSLRTRRGGKSLFDVLPDGAIRATKDLFSPGMAANPFVDRSVDPLEGRVLSFIDEQVARLA